MKTVRLMALSLRDFQGGTFQLNAAGKNVDIFATNSAGKTRLASAVSWLLFDKDSLGRSDFEIKNTDASGEKAHNLEHTVEGCLDIEETGHPGYVVTLKKVYKEQWTKKRGSATSTFTGHTQDYFIDGVPVQKKEYVQRITEIAGSEETFRLLTSPTVFPSMHWQKQRALLLDVCGDMSDADVIATDSKLANLPTILGKHKLDDYKKIVTARRSEINKSIEMIPVRIDEQRRSLPDISGMERGVIEREVMRLEDAINASKLKLQGVDNGGDIAELSKKLAGIKADINIMETDHYAKTMRTVNELNQRVIEETQKVTSAHSQMEACTKEMNIVISSISQNDILLQKLRDEWVRVDAEEQTLNVADVCNACGQSLPHDKVQAAKDLSIAMFNGSKADRLSDITCRGTEISVLVKGNKERLGKLAAERAEYESAFLAGEPKVRILAAEQSSAKAQATSYSSINGWGELNLQSASIQQQIEVARAGVSQDTQPIKDEISKMNAELVTAKTNSGKFMLREEGHKRIDELMDEEKKLAIEFEKLESELFLMESFIRTKVRLLTNRINGRFETVRFKLFNDLVNGGLEECCEITVNGIPFNSGLNNAARINAGLDVCRTLSKHYGLLAPIFADNAESVVKLIDMDAQVIRLVVSEKDAVLRVEVK